MEPGHTLTLRIQDLARGGAGVAREPSGQVVFVPYTAPGDLVEVRIKEVHKRFIQGEILKVIEASPQRIKPKCSAFTQCGGCQWQHLPYPLQWETKTKGVLHALTRVGVHPPPSVDFIEYYPAQKIWEYRNKIQLRGEGEKLGFFAAKSHDLVSLERCDIAHSKINSQFESVKKEGQKLSRPYKVEIEMDENDMVQTSWNSRHSALGFRQVHEEQNEKLKAWIDQSFQLTPHTQEVLDLYGGNGNLSVSLADRVKKIHCVDSHSRAPQAPIPQNFFFYQSPVSKWLKHTANSPHCIEMPRVAILDPPRDGLGEDLPLISQSLQKLGVNQMILVGCDPDAWARDLYRFTQKGWKLSRAAVFDFFPQTRHVESTALLHL